MIKTCKRCGEKFELSYIALSQRMKKNRPTNICRRCIIRETASKRVYHKQPPRNLSPEEQEIYVAKIKAGIKSYWDSMTPEE